MNKISEFFAGLNWVVKPLMDSPFHWPLSHYVALIKFTGRQSGREFITPIAYNRFGDTVYIALSDTTNRKWWRNYREPWPMQIKLNGKWLGGTAVVIDPGSAEFKAGFEQIFNKRSFIARIFKIKAYDKKLGLTEAQMALMLKECNGLVRMEIRK